MVEVMTNPRMEVMQTPPSEQLGDWQGYFDRIAPEWDAWMARRRGYRAQIERYLRYCVPPGSRVLEVGCATGSMLNAVEPSRGVGIDFSGKMIEQARRKFPHLEFQHVAIEDFQSDEEFDYIILDSLIGTVRDIEFVLHRVARLCRPHTRLIMSHHNSLYETVFSMASRAGIRRPQPLQNWISRREMENLLRLTGFSVVRMDDRHLCPFRVPVLEPLLERFVGRLPLLRNLNMITWTVARHTGLQRQAQPTVSVICPCRNEAGNIRQAVERLPEMGGGTELIFVEGNSTDDTLEACRQMLAEFPERNIKVIEQGRGKGKGDAVRKGYAAASGDILMILDADLTVPPEDLTKFFAAIASGTGEFINGTRLVYPMEQQAMRFLNMLGNKGFSMIFTWILGQPLSDTLCGTKVLWRKDYERLAAGRGFFGEFDPFGDFDLIFGAAKLGLEIVEVPIRYRDRTYGSTNISRFRHGWLLLKMSYLAARRIRFY